MIFESLGDRMTGSGGTGAFGLDRNNGYNDSWGHDNNYGLKYTVTFNADAGAGGHGIYRNNCNMVRPHSYGVYMWIRTT